MRLKGRRQSDRRGRRERALKLRPHFWQWRRTSLDAHSHLVFHFELHANYK